MASLPLSEIHRRALLAASKVSLSLTAASIVAAVGCGGQVDQGPPAAHVALDAAPAHDAAASPDGSPAAPVVADAAVDGSSSASDAATVVDAVADASACGAMVQAALGADAAVPSEPVDPELSKCCEQVLASWTKDGDHGVGFEAARGCCMVLGGEEWWTIGGAACTPWGPPMPPEMPDAIDATAREIA